MIAPRFARVARVAVVALDVLVILVMALLLGACSGAASGLSLSAADNDPARLQQALASAHPAAVPARALAFVLVKGEPTQLRAVDLAAGKTLWSVAADVRSRIVVGASLVSALEGADLVSRAISDGHVAWKLPLGPGARLIGLAADGDRIVYAVTETLAASRRGAWTVASVVGGRETWRLPAPGEIGAPQAAAGLVYLPLQSQWLAILDGEHGTVLARVRRNDLAIAGVRAVEGGTTYGSRAVLRLSDGPGAVPLAARLPDGIETRWFVDGYDPVQTSYSAFDRMRLLWHPAPRGGFAGPVVALSFRALFAYDPDSGVLLWARLLPRAEVVTAEDSGAAILIATADGEIVVLDPLNGAILGQVTTGARLAGAAFAVEGFRPAHPPAEPASSDEALLAMVRDKDARLGAEKRLAVRELGRRGNLAATTGLVGLITDEATPVEIAEDAAAALLGGPDARVVAPIIAALAVHADRTTGRTPRGVGVLARALGAARVSEAVAPLLDHLEDPATPPAVAGEIGAAVVLIGDAAALPRLVSVLLLSRCDPAETEIADVALDATFALGGAAERQVLSYVAEDPRTAPEVAARAREKLGR